MQELAPLIYDLAIMLGLAGLVALVFQRIHQPIVLGYLVAGMIVGPHTPPYQLVKDVANIHILSELGVIFLMFYLGLEFSFRKLTRVGFSASITGIIEVVLMIAIGYGAGRLMGWESYNALFLGAALSISSTTIIIKAMDELHLKAKRFAELIFGILVVEDLLAILLLVALSTVVITKNIFSFDMVGAVIRLVMVVGSWFLAGYFLMPPLLKRISTYISQETLTIISVALCLILVCIAASFHYSTALGAFIMGSILAETVLVSRIEDLIRPIRDIFAAVFFISVGMLIDPMVIVRHWNIVLFISAITIFGKILTTAIAAFATGQSLNTSIKVGFSMAQIGEFSFIIAGLGISLGVTDDILYPIIVAVSGITTFTTPYLIRISDKISKVIEQRMPGKIKSGFNLYSAWIYRLLASRAHPFFRSLLMRLFINALVIAIIFTLIHYVAFHYLAFFSEQSWSANTFFLMLSLLCASPFIWGMLFTHRKIKQPRAAITRAKITPFIFLIWCFTLVEVSVLSLIFFNTWTTVVIFLGAIAAFLVFSYQRLEIFYHWFEEQLTNNIRSSPHQHQYNELAPWDTHMIEIKVSPDCRFAFKTMGENLVRQLYGVNIVAIQRGQKVINAPRGNEKIMPHDKLIVLGNDEQLDVFKKEVEAIANEEITEKLMSHFRLKTYLLEGQHFFTGKSIQETGLREMINGLVVGIERNNVRILNPASDTILQNHDLLLLVGESSKLKKLNKRFFQ